MDEVEGYKVPTLNIIKSKFNKLGQKTTNVKVLPAEQAHSQKTQNFLLSKKSHKTNGH